MGVESAVARIKEGTRIHRNSSLTLDEFDPLTPRTSVSSTVLAEGKFGREINTTTLQLCNGPVKACRQFEGAKLHVSAERFWTVQSGDDARCPWSVRVPLSNSEKWYSDSFCFFGPALLRIF